MPRRKKDDEREADAARVAREHSPPPRAGLPDPASVVSEGAFTSPKGVRYRVLHTTETDAYDRPAPSPKRGRRPRARPRSGDERTGSARPSDPSAPCP